jgi:translocation and assembly module TamB
MKRTTLSFILVALLLLVSGSWFVLNTQWGLERTYELVQHSIPGKLSIQSLQGKLVGPIKLTGVNYINDEININLDRLELDWRPISLFKGTFRLNKLDAHGLSIKLTDTSGADDSKPPPSFALPLAIDVLDARLTKAHIITGQQKTFLIKQIILQGTARDNSVQLTQLTIETERFDLTTDGKVGLDNAHPVELHTTWAARLNDFTPLRGSGTFTGTLARLELKQTIKQPGLDVTLHGLLTDVISHLGWNLSLDVKQLAAQQLAASWPRISTKGKLKSTGYLDAFSLSGDLVSSLPEQGSLQSIFEINAKPEVWHLTTFKARHTPTDGTLHASGEWRPGPELGTLNLSGGWNQLVLPLSPTRRTHQFSSKTGNFTLSGGFNNYEFKANADLAGHQLPFMQVKLNGHGNQRQVKISDITALTLDGNVTGSAIASWQPQLDWEATLLAQKINPAVQWHDWPGRLNAQLHAYSKGAKDGGIYGVELKTLTGKLRNYPVDAHGSMTWGNKRFDVNDIRLTIGDSRFRMSGGRDEAWKLQAELTAPDLHTLWPYSRGKLELRVNVTGPRLTPHIIAKINGEKLVVEDYRIGVLAGDFDIDLQADEKFMTTLSAIEIAKDASHWQSVTLSADGTRTQHQIKLALKHDTDFIQLIAHAGLNAQQVWRGEITQTIFNVKDIGEWQQTKPAPFHLARNQASLEPWCLTQPGAHVCIDGEQKQNIWKAKLDAKNLSLAMFESWAPPHLRLHGKTNIDSHLQYIPERELTGNLIISTPDGFMLKVADKEQSFRFGSSKIQASLDAAGLDTNIDLPAGERGELTLRFSLPDWKPLTALPASQALAGHLKASLTSLGHLNGFFLDYPDLTGSFNTNLHFGGTIGSPLVTGETVINQASAEIPALGIKLDDVNLRAHSKTGSQVDYRISARSGEAAPLSITGYTLLQMPDGWSTKLNIRGNNFELANLPDVKINVSPQLDVEVQGRRINLTGEITVPHARFRPRTLPATSISPSQDVVIIDEAELPVVKERWKIYSHVRVILGDHVYFDGFGLQGEVSGNLLLLDEPGKPTVGQGEIRIAEGTYKAYGQDAKIRRGRLMFANTVIDDPGINLEAVREVDTVTAGVRVHGTLKQPEITLFSEPAMSESDIISYFLLGRPMDTTDDEEGQQLQKALLGARLAGGELIVDQTGIYSYVDEMTIEADKTTGQTSLVVGKYLSPKLYVRHVTGIIESSNIVEIHYKLSKYLRVQTESGHRRSDSVTGADIYYTIEY